jgi:hypothetical protein
MGNHPVCSVCEKSPKPLYAQKVYLQAIDNKLSSEIEHENRKMRKILEDIRCQVLAFDFSSLDARLNGIASWIGL